MLLRLLILAIQLKNWLWLNYWWNWKESVWSNNKYIITLEFAKFTAKDFITRSKQLNLATKADIDDLVEKTDSDDKLKNLNKKIASNKKKTCRGWKKNWSN